jgi:fumarylacetoacetase
MPPLKSWLKIDPKSHFSIHNIPLGIISTSSSSQPRPAAAIGSYALDLQAFTQGNGFSKLSIIQPHQAVFSKPTLNDFAALGRPIHRVFREYIQSVLLENGPFPDVLQENEALQKSALVSLDQCTMHLPMQIGDYTV